MMEHKNAVVGDTVKGVDFLMKKNKIYRVEGLGTITAPGTVEVTPGSGDPTIIATKNIIIATGPLQ